MNTTKTQLNLGTPKGLTVLAQPAALVLWSYLIYVLFQFCWGSS
jgi:hypothetical protein